jgi:DNA replication protein DnaC
MNATTGKLEDYDCPVCKNKGVVYFVGDDGEIRCRECACMAIRTSMARIRGSGLQNLLDVYTFDRFETETPLQHLMKSTAKKYLDDHTGKWFFIGGQSGAGKSHICTAVAGELLHRGGAVRYMLWKDESTKIKSAITDEDEYDRRVSLLKTAPVLYIDDLFKPVIDDRGTRKQPSPGDISLAFEIINSRYIAGARGKTIISSEWTMDELQRVDPATAGRIFQRAQEYCISITPGEEKNYRLRRRKP